MKKLFGTVIAVAAFAATSFAGTVGTVAVFPATTVPGGTVMVHTTEASTTAQPIKAVITVTNPGSCVEDKIPASVGSLALNLRPGVMRDASLSLTTPASACAGTYTVKVTVTNTTTNTVIATHTTTFTIAPKQP